MNDESGIVPDKLQISINYKMFLLIFAAVISFQIFLQYITPDDQDFAITLVSIFNPLAASIVGFIVAKRYLGTKVFGKSYFALALSLLMVVFGEVSYLIYDLILGIDPYPSVADLFFFAFYPLMMYHLVKNIYFFKPKIGLPTKILIIVLLIILVSIYSILSLQEIGEANFDYYYGLIFILATSAVLSMSILGASIFKQSLLGIAWLILVVGILLNAIGDIWYYYLETFDQYSISHPVNLFWWASYMVIVYALYKHKEAI